MEIVGNIVNGSLAHEALEPRRGGAMAADAPGPLVDDLRAAILRGDYAPRQRLVETDLCEQLGASRFTVRAALQELAGEGLVEIERNKGARVRAISIEEAIEISEVRMALEGLAAAQAAERATPAQVRQLTRIGEQMRRAVESAALMRYSELNGELHALIRDISGNATSTRVIEQLRAQMVRHQFTLSLLPGRPAVSLGQHEKIIEAICAHNPKAAERAMREHLLSVIETLRGLA
jgi:DNA-binding GntR family transcriptional regulator